MIRCPKCRAEKERDEFYGTPKRSGWCKACSKAKSVAYYAANRDRAREAHRRWVAANPEGVARHKAKAAYGLSDADYDRLMALPCAICGATADLVIDHCHVTGLSRGRLCNYCNKGLGFFKDDPMRLRAALRYLKRYQAGHLRGHLRGRGGGRMNADLMAGLGLLLGGAAIAVLAALQVIAAATGWRHEMLARENEKLRARYEARESWWNSLVANFHSHDDQKDTGYTDTIAGSQEAPKRPARKR